MADPIGGGGVGKATQQMMQEMMKQAQEQSQGPNKAGGAQFANKVEGVQNTQGPSEVNKVQETNKAVQTEKSLGAHQILKAAQTGQTGQTPNTTGVQRVEGAGVMEKTGMKRLLDQVAGGQGKLDQIIKMATSGKTFNQQELLAIQAGVYKFSQEMELTSKVVEKATSGVKQTMQTQV